MSHASESIRQIQAICDDLDGLHHFAAGIEKNLRNEVKAFRRPATEDGNILQLAEALPGLYRGSALLTVLGFLEHNLNAVCETLRRERDVQTRITDLPGKGMRRAKLYIQKQIGIDFPIDSDTWNHLLKYSDIRNLIAHRDSLVKDDDPELIRFINADPNLSIDDTGRVRIHEQALPRLIDYMQEFFGELTGKIDGTTS